MDGLCRLLSAPTALPLVDGRTTLVLEPLTLAGFAACEAHLLALRGDPAIRAATDPYLAKFPEEQKRLHDKACKEIRRNRSLRVVSFEQMMEWIHTHDGICFTGWWCLRVNGSPFNGIPGVRKHFKDFPEDGEEFVRRRNIVSGLDRLANLDWPEPMCYPAHHPKAGQPIEQRGRKHAPWKQNLRTVYHELHTLPPEVGKLTLFAWQTLTCDEISLIGGEAMMARARDLDNGEGGDGPKPKPVRTNRTRS